MEPPISPVIFSIVLFFGMLLLLETGRRVGIKRRPKETDDQRGGLGTIEGAIFRSVWLVGCIYLLGRCPAI
jgi:hypothetical protein